MQGKGVVCYQGEFPLSEIRGNRAFGQWAEKVWKRQ